MAKISEKYLEVFQKRSFAHLATVMEDGGPQASPVWIDTEGDLILVNSAQGRVKDRNMRRDPRVAISIVDPDNPYRAVMVRGRVVEITTEGADEHIDKLAKKYLNTSKYPYRKEGEVRVIYKVEPVSVSTMG